MHFDLKYIAFNNIILATSISLIIDLILPFVFSEHQLLIWDALISLSIKVSYSLHSSKKGFSGSIPKRIAFVLINLILNLFFVEF